MDNLPLKDRTILITGANRGIGKFLAKVAHSAGAKVFAHARSLEKLEDLLASIPATPILGDLLEADTPAKIAEQLKEHTDSLDVLVNNAAFEHVTRIETLKYADMEANLRVNLIGPVMLASELLPLLKEGNHPTVINISSIHDSMPMGGNGPYTMAKAGLNMFTLNAAMEWAEYGIRVNTLAPGAIETDMNRELINDFGRHHFDKWIPSSRVGDCDDLAGPFLLLAGTQSLYCNAMRLCVDGGYEQNVARYQLDRDPPIEK